MSVQRSALLRVTTVGVPASRTMLLPTKIAGATITTAWLSPRDPR